jgi:hypothetical protein
MPVDDLTALSLLRTRRRGTSGGAWQPQTLAEILQRERELQQRLEPVQWPRPPLTAAGGPSGGAGGVADIEAAVGGLGHAPPEIAGQGPVVPEAPVKTAAAQEELDRLQRQKWGAFAKTAADVITPFIKLAFSGPRITGRVDQWSARDTKRDVAKKSDRKTLGDVLNTPTVTYRYKDEPRSAPKRTGVIAEESPDGMTNAEKTMVDLPAWIEHLEASVRALARDVAALRRR